ncbi:CC0125/CC1285 family lipoprotein [Thalassotalea agarivorans]|uniref:Lipoprotein n=1 Tax=Thalassotalea agarivorans TaxID=349064 RepID=A0A1I0E7N6_THASX|nr:hypothetical protein [Thalassotalea agarivorans]SET40300.1 hypothetical protein SAMN05660429_01736 [Thalassotalea agarivorans]
MKYAIAIASVFLIASCATPYAKYSWASGTGYSSSQLGDKVFSVSFQGDGSTDIQRAKDFALLRSAEISWQHRCSHFIILGSSQQVTQSTVTTPKTTSTNYYSGVAQTTTSGGYTYSIAAPSTSNTIMCFSEKPEGFSYSVDFIMKSLKTKYNL